MKRTLSSYFAFIAVVFAVLISSQSQSQTVVQWYTSMGDFRVQLREDLVPMTAQNFIDLTTDNFYDDLIFHRVIEGFMIQDGCPDGTGYGGPGYTFDDEFHPDLRHDEPGMLSMANSGPNTNGSQYFITVAPTAWLDDVHAVFGKVMDGMEVVYAISEVETNASDKPLIDVVIDSIRVVVGDPMVELLAPLDGGKWNAAGENEITWNSAFIADVKIEFSSDNGQSWVDVVASSSANTRSYMWTAPAIVSDQCLIKISDVANPDVFSVNETPFTLCSLDLLSPDGFEVFMVDIPVTVTWTSEFVGDLSIYYMPEENGEWVLIAEGIPAENESYEWIPEVSSSWCKLKVAETAYPLVADESGFRFFVYKLDLLSPQGGEDLEGLSPFEIEWEAEVIPNVKVEFSSDNGDTWELVDANASIDESPYAWEVPNINAQACYIKLSVPNESGLFKQNSTSFSIHKAVGIEELEQQLFKLYPNPVQDQLAIQISQQASGVALITILDANGHQVSDKSIEFNTHGDQSITLDLAALAPGLYLICIENGNTKSYQKFIKTSN